MADSGSMDRQFAQVDVFTSEAVGATRWPSCLTRERALDRAMAQVAGWTNLSETTFIVSPTDGRADYGVRVFAAGGGTAVRRPSDARLGHAWLEPGGSPGIPIDGPGVRHWAGPGAADAAG